MNELIWVVGALLLVMIAWVVITVSQRRCDTLPKLVFFNDQESAAEAKKEYDEYMAKVKPFIELKKAVHQKLVKEIDSVIRAVSRSTDKNKKIVLLIGYGAFGHVPTQFCRENISENIVRSFPSFPCGLEEKVEIIKIVLPVEWKVVKETYKRLFNKLTQIDAIIAMGYDWSADALTVERYYFNVCWDLDALYNLKCFEKIQPDGPDVIETNVPLENILENLSASGIPAKVYTGKDILERMTYLCNYSAYLAAYHSLKKSRGTKFVFIHVPPINKVSLEKDIEAINIILKTLL